MFANGERVPGYIAAPEIEKRFSGNGNTGSTGGNGS
jgi:hypothetical protein